jgi:hypothetical protein
MRRQVGDGGGEAGALCADDDVEFTVVLDRRTGAVRAEDVRLLARAADRRELGQARALALQPTVCLIEPCGVYIWIEGVPTHGSGVLPSASPHLTG